MATPGTAAEVRRVETRTSIALQHTVPALQANRVEVPKAFIKSFGAGGSLARPRHRNVKGRETERLPRMQNVL